MLIATPTISAASHRNAAARLLWRAMIPMPAGPASIPAYPRVVSAGTARACGIVFWRPVALKRTGTMLEHPTPISAYPPREICHEGTTVETIYERAAWIVEVCKRERFRYSPRLHIDLWGDKRGV